MLNRWRTNREVKRIKNEMKVEAQLKKQLQAQCLHQRHEVNTCRVWDKYFHSYEVEHDVYCPLCDKKEFGVSDTTFKVHMKA